MKNLVAPTKVFFFFSISFQKDLTLTLQERGFQIDGNVCRTMEQSVDDELFRDTNEEDEIEARICHGEEEESKEEDINDKEEEEEDEGTLFQQESCYRG